MKELLSWWLSAVLLNLSSAVPFKTVPHVVVSLNHNIIFVDT